MANLSASQISAETKAFMDYESKRRQHKQDFAAMAEKYKPGKLETPLLNFIRGFRERLRGPKKRPVGNFDMKQRMARYLDIQDRAPK